MKQFIQDLVKSQTPEVQATILRARNLMKHSISVDTATCLAYLENAEDQGLELPLNWSSLDFEELLDLTSLVWTLRSKRLGYHSLAVESLAAIQ